MAGSRRIVIEFLGKDTSLSKTSRDADQNVSKLGKRMDGVGKVAGRVFAGGMLLAGAAAVKAGNAAAEDEAAQSKLANTLRNTTGATKGQIAATEAWITAQGKSLGVADDELRPALAKLVTATKDVGEAQKLSALAMDISAGSGKSLEQVTTALQKGVNGSVGGLSRLGVATKNADGSTKSLNQITKELAKTYAGDAAKAADTTAGKQRKLKVQFGELQEEIGMKLLPVMAKLADWGLKTVSWMGKNQKLVKILGGAFAGIVGTLYLVSKAMAAVNLVMSLNPIGAVILAVAALVAGLVVAYKNSETFRKIVDGAFRGVAAAGKFMWEGVLKPTFKFLINGFLSVVGGIISGAARAFGWVPGLGPKLKAAAASFSEFRKDVNRQLDGTKDKKTITITTPGASTAIGNLATIKRLMNDIKSGKSPKAPTGGGLIGAGLGSNARGTDNWRGGLTRVHEQGDEIIDLPKYTRIIPHSMSKRVAAQSGAGGDFTVTAPVVLQMDSKAVWQGLLKLKRTSGGIELGLA